MISLIFSSSVNDLFAEQILLAHKGFRREAAASCAGTLRCGARQRRSVTSVQRAHG